MSTTRLYALLSIKGKPLIEQILLDEFNHKSPSEKTVEFLQMFFPLGTEEETVSDVFKATKACLDVLDNSLQPYLEECGIEIGSAFTLKSGERGQTYATEKCDIYLKIDKPHFLLQLLTMQNQKAAGLKTMEGDAESKLYYNFDNLAASPSSEVTTESHKIVPKHRR